MTDALLATVTEEVAAVQAFESLLEHEEKALIAAQPIAALSEIIANKTALTELIAEQWTLLRDAARRAKQGNNNGVLIRTRMEYNRKALAALQVAPAKASFYGPDGRLPGS
ncbi:Flagellar biosynthesis protein FlgN [Candidatus Burkholderia humilis]|nr:Flagellar biosynthesis protein FlgN [Candidatus Burkholderia humilis]